MKINGPKLTKITSERKLTPEQLAAALPKPSERRKQGDVALKKVRNWMAGKDHPRCSPAEAAAMAQALGVETKDLVRFTSTFRFARGSWRKIGLVAELIRGRRFDEADALLQFSPKRAAVQVRKALNAARADAEAAGAAVDRLVVAESRVGNAMRIKRFQPKDRGRAHPILKRTSHIVVGVEEMPARR
ncbi:MAG: 50S ribosomal protein L22 [Planctomycetota bacterium]|nr:50S ribosomal protein L22 [Planctomycetota bacterium]